MSKTRQDLSRLQAMCKEWGKVSPSDWPEGLIGVGPDMRRWVKAQEDAKSQPKKKSSVVKKNAEKSESKPVEKSE
tara:strand:+ start:1127 stop:1351 length:225 start_codon:yes stop_codon:yes gene_type:complete